MLYTILRHTLILEESQYSMTLYSTHHADVMITTVGDLKGTKKKAVAASSLIRVCLYVWSNCA